MSQNLNTQSALAADEAELLELYRTKDMVGMVDFASKRILPRPQLFDTPAPQSELTAEELALIAAYRARNMEVIAEIATPKPEPTCPHEELDSIERLALHIIGTMALNLCLTRSMLVDDGLTVLWRDTTAAIKAALPRLDMVEIERISREVKQHG